MPDEETVKKDGRIRRKAVFSTADDDLDDGSDNENADVDEDDDNDEDDNEEDENEEDEKEIDLDSVPPKKKTKLQVNKSFGSTFINF